MATCFVIQPFDRGPFDKRFDDVFAPAIKAAGLEPYRVDRDPGASVPIEDIESGIRGATVCLADISEDNPNVWFELGFAIAARKPVVLVSRSDRFKFPFDVQHRRIITYETESVRDFDELNTKITSQLKAALQKQQRLANVAELSDVAAIEGLTQHEIAALVAVAENTDALGGSVATYLIRRDMEKSGFTRVAVTLALLALSGKGMLSISEQYDNRDHEPYMAYLLQDSGVQWLQQNQQHLVLKRDGELQEISEDDIPF